jgi:hypothetical protein
VAAGYSNQQARPHAAKGIKTEVTIGGTVSRFEDALEVAISEEGRRLSQSQVNVAKAEPHRPRGVTVNYSLQMVRTINIAI